MLTRLRRDPCAVVGAVILVLVAAALAGAPWLAPDPISADVANRLAPWSWHHPLGTDGLGRDLFSRVLHGGRTSVALTVVVTAIATVTGVVLGVLAGQLGGLVDAAVMRLVEIIQSLPLVIVIMATAGLLGGGPTKLVLVLAAFGWTNQARVVRASALTLRERDFVQACHVIGASRRRIAFRHLVPNLLGPVVVMATLDVGRVLLLLSTLSFLGLGTRPPHPEWGSMLAEARIYFFAAPRLLIIPGVAIFLVALATNLFGEGLRDALDVRSRRMAGA